MMFIYNTAKFAPVFFSILKIRAIFVHQTLTEHVLYQKVNLPTAFLCPIRQH